MTTSPRFAASKPKRLTVTIGSALVAAAAIAAATLIALHSGEVTASEQPTDAPAVPVSGASKRSSTSHHDPFDLTLSQRVISQRVGNVS